MLLYLHKRLLQISGAIAISLFICSRAAAYTKQWHWNETINSSGFTVCLNKLFKPEAVWRSQHLPSEADVHFPAAFSRRIRNRITLSIFDRECIGIGQQVIKFVPLEIQVKRIGNFNFDSTCPIPNSVRVSQQNLNERFLNAAFKGNLSLVARLLHEGADINARNPDGQTALLQAASERHVALVKFLLNRHALVNIRDKFGASALTFSLGNPNRSPIPGMLLRAGADPNVKPQNEETPLISAIGSVPQMRELVIQLLKRGADPNVPSSTGFTPLQAAVMQRSSPRIIRSLVAHGANVNAIGPDTTALMLAWREEDINLLVKCGAKLELRDAEGNTALMRQARRSTTENVDALVKLGALIDVMNNDGDTALIVASRAGAAGTVFDLIRLGANTKLRNKMGQSAFDVTSDSLIKYIMLHHQYPSEM